MATSYTTTSRFRLQLLRQLRMSVPPDRRQTQRLTARLPASKDPNFLSTNTSRHYGLSPSGFLSVRLTMHRACLREFPRWRSQYFGVRENLLWRIILKSIVCSHTTSKGSFAVATRNYIAAKMPVASMEVSSLTESNGSNDSSGCCSRSSGRRSFQIIVAATKELGIGLNGTLPWKLPADMAFFKELTTATESTKKVNAVIMGRKTWESLPAKFRPLPRRLNVVLTKEYLSSPEYCPDNVQKCSSLDAALDSLSDPGVSSQIEQIFVIGGAQIFR